jgi:hypothetical protein
MVTGSPQVQSTAILSFHRRQDLLPTCRVYLCKGEGTLKQNSRSYIF